MKYTGPVGSKASSTFTFNQDWSNLGDLTALEFSSNGGHISGIVLEYVRHMGLTLDKGKYLTITECNFLALGRIEGQPS